jgi:hypothetical protein
VKCVAVFQLSAFYKNRPDIANVCNLLTPVLEREKWNLIRIVQVTNNSDFRVKRISQDIGIPA